MKNKLIIVALITVILAVGMVLVSCSNCPGDGKCNLYDTSLTQCYYKNGVNVNDCIQSILDPDCGC